jgi:NDP-sugar pyrophosphorylase family protein
MDIVGNSGASRVTTAYVLAAGLGTRLKPLTLERPKPLLEVCGTRLVDFALKLLERAGIRRVAINSHWLHPQVPEAVGLRFGEIDIVTTHEPVVLGTGGGLQGLAKVCPVLPRERVLVLNADALIDLDVRALLAADRIDGMATLVLKDDADKEKYGLLGTDADGRITTFAGRVTPQGDVLQERMFCGVHVMDLRVLEVLPEVAVTAGVATGLESGVNDQGYPVWMARGEKLYAFDHAGTFCDVGTPERLLEANLNLLAGLWPSEHLRPFDGLKERQRGVWIHPSANVDDKARLIAPVLVHADAHIAPFADVGPLAVVGKGCVVGSKARLAACVLQSGARVDDTAIDCIVSPQHRVVVDGSIGQAVRRATRDGG